MGNETREQLVDALAEATVTLLEAAKALKGTELGKEIGQRAVRYSKIVRAQRRVS